MTPSRAAPGAPGAPERALEGALRLLVVDDDAVDRQAVRRALRRTGLADAQVHEAGDADEALRLLAGANGAAAPFDCVLLDFQLAGDTGFDVLRRLADRAHAVPVVMLTGQSDPETAAALIRAGAVDFLTKDALTPERLEQSVRGAVRMAHVERDLQASRELLATTLRSIADAVVTIDPDGRVTYMNAAAERLTGWPLDEATRRPLADVAFVVAADADGEGLAEAYLHARVQRVLGGHRADDRADMTLVARDGVQLYVDATVTPLRDAAGTTVGAVIALRDITERRRAEVALATAHGELQQQSTTLEQQAVELEQQFEEAQALTEELEQANAHLLEVNLRMERSEARYRALVEASAQVVWATDAHGMVADMPAWRALTGQTPDEVRGQGWLDALHPDDRERSAATWWSAFERRALYENEYRLRMADGRHRWHRARGVPVLDAGGAIREWVGTLTDVDDERRAEEARREETVLVEALHRIGGVLASELELERIVQTVTDETTALTGAQFGAFFYNQLDRQGEQYTLYTLAGAPREAFDDFGHPRATPVFAPTFHGTGIVRSDDITADPRYGRMAPHRGMPPGHLPVRSYLAVPVTSRGGDVIGGLFYGHAEPGVFTERSERLVSGVAASAAVAMDNARLYEAERRARAEAEAANKAKAEFLARMSHDLRTPLNAIGGYTQLVELEVHGPVTDAQREALGRVRRAQEHLLTLINDILSFAKLEAGQVSMRPEDVPVAPLLQELAELVRPEADARGLSIAVEPGASDVLARADRERLVQVLLNLTTNALKFTRTGGIRLAAHAADAWVELRVHDTGLGIPAERLAAIFDPFVQVHGSTTERNGGVGLGLAISRELARTMGGDLTVTSVEGQGSTFTVRIPRAIASAAAPT